MKSPLLAVLAALQLATLGLVVGLMLERNGSNANPEIERLTQAVQGALNQERVIIQYLEQMRREAAASRSPQAPTDPAPGSELEPGPPEPAPSDPGHAAAPPDAASPFPAAAAAIAELKRIHQSLRTEQKSDSQNVGPLKQELDRRKSALIGQGHGAVYVVRREIDLQPYEPGRDPQFVIYLLEQIVPALSSNAKDEALDIARSALVRQTNEPGIKLAGGKAMKAIDPNRWVKDVGDVIALGKGSEADLRAQLLGLFETAPRPEAVELCRRFLEDSSAPMSLRDRSITVIEKQDSSGVNPILRRVLFEDTAPNLKIRALDALWNRLKDDAERRKLVQSVLDENPARMPDSVQEKARRQLAQLDAPAAKPDGQK